MKRNEAEQILNALVGLPLAAARKIDPFELYEFLFGDLHMYQITDENGKSTKKVQFTYCLHVLCNISICNVSLDGWSSNSELQQSIQAILGKKVKQVALTEQNILCIYFACGEMIVHPVSSGDEAWRFFSSNQSLPHLVAYSDTIALES